MLKEIVKNLPQRPGVYLFKNADDEVIYVGKAKNLKARVGSYFQKGIDSGSKTRALVQNLSRIDFIEVVSEIEALVLEAHLIQKYNPRYNIVLKDDKSFLYIEIRKRYVEKDGQKVNIPVLRVSRKSDLEDDSDFFGPFPSSSSTRFVLRALRRYFPYRDCSNSKFSKYSKMGRPCLYGKINLCPAPCIDGISVEEYMQHIFSIKDFLEGKSSEIISSLEDKMKASAGNKDYEQAAVYRDMIDKFSYIRKKRVPANLYSQNPNLREDIASKSLKEIKDMLPILEEIPKRIECYDISDLSGEDSVGSMVVAEEGKIERSQYKKFKIKSIEGPDDFAKMAEVLERRLRHLQENSQNWKKPDLIVLDGGRGQISAVLDVFKKLNIEQIPLIGLAKKEEKIIYKDKERFKEISLEEKGNPSEGLKLLIRLRDEAHRFAQAYHHKLRIKDLLE